MPGTGRILIEIARIGLKQLRPPLEHCAEVIRKARRRFQRRRRSVELGARVGKVHHEFAASEREADKLVEVARQLHAMIAHQVLNPFRQRAAVKDLIELGAGFLLLVLADEQAQAMPSQRVIGRRACLDRA